jgi:hypothetical protein
MQGTSIDIGFEIATEINPMLTLGTDIQGLSETNKPWTTTNRWKYDFMMDAVFVDPLIPDMRTSMHPASWAWTDHTQLSLPHLPTPPKCSTRANLALINNLGIVYHQY